MNSLSDSRVKQLTTRATRRRETRPDKSGRRNGVIMRILGISALLLLLWFPSPAKPVWRSMAGVVKDAAGNALPAAVVQLENENDLSVRSYITAADGRYQFRKLRYDTDYTLKARYRKYWSKPKALSKFNEAAHPEIDLIIPID